MENKIREYAKTRAAIEQAKNHMKSMVDAVKSSIEYQQYENFITAESVGLAELETTIKEHALTEFESSGNKKPYSGIGIREMTRIDYDENLAVLYCKNSYPELLTVKQKPFEKLALGLNSAGLVPEFITIRKEPVATIASDLSEYIDMDESEGE